MYMKKMQKQPANICVKMYLYIRICLVITQLIKLTDISRRVLSANNSTIKWWCQRVSAYINCTSLTFCIILRLFCTDVPQRKIYMNSLFRMQCHSCHEEITYSQIMASILRTIWSDMNSIAYFFISFYKAFMILTPFVTIILVRKSCNLFSWLTLPKFEWIQGWNIGNASRWPFPIVW